MLDVDLANYNAIAMPPGEAHERRDQSLRDKRAAGVEAFSGDDADLVAAIWEVGYLILVSGWITR